jgi:hypothetical protein
MLLGFMQSQSVAAAAAVLVAVQVAPQAAVAVAVLLWVGLDQQALMQLAQVAQEVLQVLPHLALLVEQLLLVVCAQAAAAAVLITVLLQGVLVLQEAQAQAVVVHLVQVLQVELEALLQREQFLQIK